MEPKPGNMEISEGVENVRQPVEDGRRYIQRRTTELEAGLGNIRPDFLKAVRNLLVVL